MKAIKYIVIAFLLSVMPMVGIAQVAITESGNSITVNFTLPNYQVKDTTDADLFGNTVYKYIDIEDFGIIADEGFPELPQLTIDLGVDDNTSDYSVAMSNLTVTEISLNHRILPFQDFEADVDTLIVAIDENYYLSDGSAYNRYYALSDPFSVMGAKGVSLTMFPFVYVPDQNKLKVVTSATFTISYNCSGTARSVSDVSEDKANFLNNVFANTPYSSSPITYSGTANWPSGKYVIITPERFKSTLAYFASYKRNLGYDVWVVSTDSIGSTKTDIHNFLSGLYCGTDVNDYLLLVGDIDDIPASGGTIGDGSDRENPLTDLYYSLWSGNESGGISDGDLISDLFIGRWPVADTNQLINIINKTIFMETYMATFEKKAVLLSGSDHEKNAVEKRNRDCINNIHKKPFGSNGWLVDKYIGYNSGATRQDGLNALNGDYLHFVYSGHGSVNRFAEPYNIYKVNIDSATNTLYPMVYTCGCKTGNYGHSGGAIGEGWINSLKGSISFFGPSVNSNVIPGKIILEEVMKPLNNVSHIGEMIVIGKKNYANNFWRKLAIRTTRHMEMYNFFGDPSFFLSGISNYANLVLAAGDNVPDGGKVTYTATNTIENGGTFVLQSGSKVDLLAGEKIHLKQGFHGKRGAFFTAKTGNIPARSTGITSRSLVLSDEDREAYLNILSDENETIIENRFAYCVFPNPVTDMAIIRIESDKLSLVSIYVYDMGGKLVQSLTGQQMNETVQFFNLPFSDKQQGVYPYHIIVGDKQYDGKIIKTTK